MPLRGASGQIPQQLLKQGDEQGQQQLQNYNSEIKTRIMIDIDNQQEIENNIQQIIKQARLRAFIDMYPYLAGLDSKEVKQMTDSRKIEIIKNITQDLPKESSPDDILGELFSIYVFDDDDENKVGVVSEKLDSNENEETIVREIVHNIRTNKKLDVDTTKKQSIKKIKETLIPIIGKLKSVINLERSEKNIQDIMREHESIAMAETLENEIIDIFEQQLKGVTLENSQIKQAIVIDARDTKQSGFNLNLIIPGLINLSKIKELEIRIITDDKTQITQQLPENVKKIKQAKIGENLIESLKNDLPAGIINSRISIATADMLINGKNITDGIIDHINNNKLDMQQTSNFVVIGKPMQDEKQETINHRIRLIPTMVAMNLLKRQVTLEDNPQIITIESDTKNSISAKFKNTIKDVVISLQVITKLDISKMIRDFVISLQSIESAV